MVAGEGPPCAPRSSSATSAEQAPATTDSAGEVKASDTAGATPTGKRSEAPVWPSVSVTVSCCCAAASPSVTCAPDS